MAAATLRIDLSMATYSYIARDTAGRRVTGRHAGASEQSVLAELQARELAPVRVALLENGVPMLVAMQIARDAVGHPLMAVNLACRFEPADGRDPVRSSVYSIQIGRR